MNFGLSIVTEPATEPISTADAKAHLRVDTSDDDTFIDGLIAAARRHAEIATNRAFITQTWKLTLDRWPDSGVIMVPKPPLQSVTSITYLDSDGVSQMWDSSNYRVDTARTTHARITPVYDVSWPVTRGVTASIAVTFVCGYGAASDVPDDLVAAMKLLVGNWYENREATIVGTTANEIPMAAAALLRSRTVPEVG